MELRPRRWLLIGVGLGLVFGSVLLGLGRISKARRPKVAEAVLVRAALPPCTSAEPAVFVSWVGVAGVRIESCPGGGGAAEVLLIDPYLTRHSTFELLWPVDADKPTLARAFPRADAILVGHSHHDHLGDVPQLALRTHARVVGTRSTCTLAKAMALPEPQCSVIADGAHFALGSFEVTAFEHPHAEAKLFGVPFPGEVLSAPPRLPMTWEMKMGGALAYLVRVQGKTIYVQSSAGLDDRLLQRLDGLRPDAAFIAIALRQQVPDFEARLFARFKPARVFPTHHDLFLGSVLTDSPELYGGVHPDDFRRAVDQQVAAGTFLNPPPFVRTRL